MTNVRRREVRAQSPAPGCRFRVIMWDGPGHGGADRPAGPQRYIAEGHVALALDGLDATGTERAVLATSSGGTHRALKLAADQVLVIQGTEMPRRWSGVPGPYVPAQPGPPSGTAEVTCRPVGPPDQAGRGPAIRVRGLESHLEMNTSTCRLVVRQITSRQLRSRLNFAVASARRQCRHGYHTRRLT